eukprot:CAMPEP_0118918458 /NCGR_PEP_ID=MMETSP1166-20130328/17925_1 /TAXON_ID=1104430 /ORGANISM="Chrysoreinhardia sp, Strain CCMP3193" /LENGTH=224 /DNA_ID=CAMNT_0006858759 /DNA_START=138 /DNA_END=813 /DNA_ORIENTATION=+
MAEEAGTSPRRGGTSTTGSAVASAVGRDLAAGEGADRPADVPEDPEELQVALDGFIDWRGLLDAVGNVDDEVQLGGLLNGGKLQMKGTELQLHKNWIFGLGSPNLAANLRFKAAIDVATGKMSARFGFRTEQTTSAINVVDGVDVVKKLPLDGNDGHAKLEVKVRVAFPQPDIALDAAGSAGAANGENNGGGDKDNKNLVENEVLLGMGDLEIDVDEVNLCLDW